MTSLQQIARDAVALTRLPRITINLMAGATAQNDPFYGRVVREFYAGTQQRHPKFPLVRALEWGVAVCTLPPTFDDYCMQIEAAGRRNFKKCARNGYEFARIAYNDHLADIQAIRRSAPVRQGRLPEEFLNEELKPCLDPPSRTRVHDYPYFGVLREGHLVAFAGGLVSGAVFVLEQLYGHAAHQADGVVPFLLVNMVRYLREHFPSVQYCAYGSFFGAGTTLRRFKRKFGFVPCRVTWVLDRTVPAVPAGDGGLQEPGRERAPGAGGPPPGRLLPGAGCGKQRATRCWK